MLEKGTAPKNKDGLLSYCLASSVVLWISSLFLLVIVTR